MDAHDLLVADHNRVRGLFKRFKDAEESDDTSAMHGIADKIVEELQIHTTIEEELYYPAVTDTSEEIHDVVEEGIQEHHVAKTLIAELGQVEPGGDEWKAKVKVLIEAVEHHAEEEEKEMFPKVERTLADGKLETLGEKLLARKLDLGAPPPAIDLTKAELLSKASEQEIPGRSKMSHDELAMTVDPR